jgi:hypothetical protein
VFVLTGIGPAGSALAQSNANAPSPASAGLRVVAQGVAAMPAADVAWRIVRDTAEASGASEYESRAIGFALAAEDAILIDDQTTGLLHRLAPDEAAFVVDGALQRRLSLGPGPTAYYRISLVPAEQATDGGGDELIYAGDAFAAPAGLRDIDLVGGEVGTTPVSLDPGGFELLLFVTDGAVLVRLADEGVSVEAGNAVVLSGGPADVVANGSGQASFVAAIIGPDVSGGTEIEESDEVVEVTEPVASDSDVVEQPTDGGTVRVSTFRCPPGYDFPIQLDGPSPDCTEPISGVAVGLDPADGGEYIEAATDESGVALLEDVPAGSYTLIVINPERPADRVVCGSALQGLIGNGDSLKVSGGEQISCTVNYLQAGGTATLRVQAFDCEPGYRFPEGAWDGHLDCTIPLPGVEVDVMSLSTADHFPVTTGSDGSAILTLPEDNYQIAFDLPADNPTRIVCGGPGVGLLGGVEDQIIVIPLAAGDEISCSSNSHAPATWADAGRPPAILVARPNPAS